MKKHSKGFSMIELIIVVAIIGIFTGLVSIGFGYIQSGNLRSAAQTINSNLSKLKYDAMSKENKQYMYIYQTGNGYYFLCSDQEESSLSFTSGVGQQICNSSCSITVDGGTPIGTTPKRIAYKKGSGGFDTSKSTITQDITIKKSDGTGTGYVVKLVTETGKHYVERIN